MDMAAPTIRGTPMNYMSNASVQVTMGNDHALGHQKIMKPSHLTLGDKGAKLACHSADVRQLKGRTSSSLKSKTY